jgi:hypothetical protein
MDDMGILARGLGAMLNLPSGILICVRVFEALRGLWFELRGSCAHADVYQIFEIEHRAL